MGTALTLAIICLLLNLINNRCDAVPTGQSASFNITNEQMRGAMLTLVASYNNLENNLERHEVRERALGEVLKKGLQSLHKGQRIFEPMRGTFTRLDERISQMETLLIARDAEIKNEQKIIVESLQTITKWMANNDAVTSAWRKNHDQQHVDVNNALSDLRKQGIQKESKSSQNDDDDDDIGKKIDDLAEDVKLLRQAIAESLADRSHSDDLVKSAIAQTEQAIQSNKHSNQNQISDITEKLSQMNVSIITACQQESFKENLTSELQTQLSSIENGIRKLQGSISNNDNLTEMPDRIFFKTLTNETLEAIQDMRIEVLTATDKTFAKTATRIKEATTSVDEAINEAARALSESITHLPSAQVSQAANDDKLTDIIKLNEKLREDVADLRNTEQNRTDKSVLALKKSIEFNVHSITAEIGDLIHDHVAQIDSTLIVQFGLLNETIHANHNAALNNLTTKIESEISQVWRQIGFMFRMVQSTELSLNETSSAMDGMGGKVSTITERMAEVDSNLNYLLGRLSLVTQEFNQIKTGLGTALDNIRSSFESVQRKIQDVGPGPHNIDNETD